MKRAIILHGTMGSPEGNWFQWLKQELEAIGIVVWVPQLPHAAQPSLQRWLEFIVTKCPFKIDGDTLIVGHSSGAICATLLAQKQVTIGAVVGVSVFCDNSLKWEPNAKLFDVAFDWDTLRSISSKLLYVHSDNDPYVPLEKAQYVAKQIGAEMLVWHDQGHFNLEKSNSYKKFPKLLKELRERKYV